MTICCLKCSESGEYWWSMKETDDGDYDAAAL